MVAPSKDWSLKVFNKLINQKKKDEKKCEFKFKVELG